MKAQRYFVKLLCFIFLFIHSSFVFGADDQVPEEVQSIVLPRKTVLDNDYFANGKIVEISGTVNGDVYVFGAQVFIDGKVNGDVLVAGGNIEISGNVSGNIRLIGGQALISGQIGGNVTAVAGTIAFTPSADIGKNIIALSGNVDLSAKVTGNARIYASNLRISNAILGNIVAYVGQMRVTSKGEVGGRLEYWSNTTAFIDPEARLAKGIDHHPSFFYGVVHGKFFKSLKIGSKFAALVMNFLYSLLIGFIFISYFKDRIHRSLSAINHKPFQSIITGIVLILLLPLAFLVLLMTVVGAPFALTLLALNIISFYTAKIISILWISEHIFSRFAYRKRIKLYFTLSLIIYFILTLIPYFGFLVSLFALFLGLGGVVVGKIEETPAKKRLFG